MLPPMMKGINSSFISHDLLLISPIAIKIKVHPRRELYSPSRTKFENVTSIKSGKAKTTNIAKNAKYKERFESVDFILVLLSLEID
jgi:hypothetical protein